MVNEAMTDKSEGAKDRAEMDAFSWIQTDDNDVYLKE